MTLSLADTSAPTSTPFKGIALFTPAGDVVYCIDPQKRDRWHLQLCAALQEVFGLPEPPYFLVPAYTASLDCWLDARTQKLQTAAEVHPAVARYQGLLNILFNTGHLRWQTVGNGVEIPQPLVLETYRDRFPQLWQNHDLILNLNHLSQFLHQTNLPLPLAHHLPAPEAHLPAKGYVLRLFVSGHTSATERTLQRLHQLLQESLPYPYTLKVIDILKHPEQAEQDQVAATPTLLRVWPRPARRIVGELRFDQSVMRLLTMP